MVQNSELLIHDDGMNGRIVVGVDGSESAAEALRWAVGEAARRSAGLDVVHAWQHPALFTPAARAVEPNVRALVKEAAQRLLHTAIASAAPHQHVKVRPLLLEGSPGPVLLEAGRHADALVVGTRGLGGIDRLLLGSVSAYCVNHAQGPVVVVPPSSGHSPGDRAEPPSGVATTNGAIVVGVDGSEGSQVALGWALSEAITNESPLVVVCAYSALTDAEAAVSDALDRVGTRDGLEVSTRIVEGQPAKVLAAAGTGARMLVVGTRGLGGFRGLMLGSTSHELAHNPPCPLAIVATPHGGESPLPPTV